MRLLLLLLFATAAAAQTDFPIASQRTGPAPEIRRDVRVATSREAALVVWDDERGLKNVVRAWGARVAKSGALLDPTGIVLGPPQPSLPGSVRAVASDGDGFLVLTCRSGQLHLTHVSAEGQVTEGAVLGGDTYETRIALVWLGSEYALFYTEGTANLAPRVLLVILDREGRILIGPREVLRSKSGLTAVDAAVGNGGADVLLVWGDNSDGKLHEVRLPVADLRRGITPTIGEVAPLLGLRTPLWVDVASDGNGYLIAWLHHPSHDRNDVRVRRVSAGGVALGEIVLFNDAIDRAPAVAWNGTHYAVISHGRIDSLLIHRVRPDGSAPTGVTLSTGTTFFNTEAASWSSGEVLAVWSVSDHGGGNYIAGDILTPAGTAQFGSPAGSMLISQSFPDRRDASVVWRGDHYLATWNDTFDHRVWTMYGRFTASGVPLDGPGRTASLPGSFEQSLASDGRGALLAWREEGGINVGFIDEAGNLTRVHRTFPAHSSLVHWNGSQYVAMWNDSNSLRGMRFDARGNPIDAQPVVLHPELFRLQGIGWTGSQYFVFTRSFGVCSPPPFCQPPVHLDALGVSRELAPIGGIVRLARDRVSGELALGESAAGLLVVFGWRDGPRLRGIRFAHNGTPLDTPNGFDIGDDGLVTVHAAADGWNIVVGANQLHVSASGRVTGPVLAYPFVPADQRVVVVPGGPAPLVVYPRPPVGTQQSKEIRARLLVSARRRLVR